LSTIWEDILASPKPLSTSKYPGMPGVNADKLIKDDIFIPNSHAIIF